MALLGRFTKQPAEVIDYPVDFAGWFAGRSGVSIASYTVTAETGITVSTHRKDGFVVTAVMAGGTAGATYKVTVRITTSSGLVKEAEFTIKVRET
jgi:hypothetical protein